MRKTIAIVFLLSILAAHSQERFFTYLEGWTNYGLFEEGSSYLSYGLVQDGDLYNQLLFERIDLLGNYESSTLFSADTSSAVNILRVNSVYKDDEGNIYSASLITGEDSAREYGLFTQHSETLDSSELSVTFDFAEDQTFFYSVSPAHVTGNFLLTSSIYDEGSAPHTGVTEVNSEGMIIWHQEFVSEADPAVDWLLPWHILPTPDGGYLLTVRELYAPGGTGVDDEHHVNLIKLDALGNEEWRIYPANANFWSEPGWPVLLDDGTVYFCWTDPRVVSGTVDQFNFNATVHYANINLDDGGIIEEGEYSSVIPTYNSDPDLSHDYFLYQTQLLSDGTILLSGYDTYHAFLMKVNQEGEYIWHRTILNPDQMGEELDVYGRFHLKGVRETSDGGFICGGEFNVFPGGEIFPGGIQTAFAMKLDGYGCLEEGCQLVGLAEEEIGTLKVYPNPTTGDLRVVLPSRLPLDVRNGGRAAAEVVVFDALGRAVSNFKFQVHTSADGESLNLNIEGLPNGMYVLRLLTQDSVYSSRILKE
jgi:hypothetical protein